MLKFKHEFFLIIFVMLVSFMLFSSCSSSSSDQIENIVEEVVPADVEGQWELSYKEVGKTEETGPELLEISQKGVSLTLTRYPAGAKPASSSGTVTAKDIFMTLAESGVHFKMSMIGKVAADKTMSGTWTTIDGKHGTWDAVFNTLKPIVLINIGDSLTNGVQSGDHNVNEFTQLNSFTQLIANQMDQSAFLLWANPLLSVNGERKDWDIIPYNLGVSGATAKSLVEQKTNSGNDLMDKLLTPIPNLKGSEVSQIDAAEYIAGLYPGKQKVFTLWIGNNDVLGTVTAGGGTQITIDAINTFLSDTEAGHDIDSVLNNITIAVDRLKAIPDSHIFIGTLPNVTNIAFLFNEKDLERLAIFPNADVVVLEPGQSIGFGAFLNPVLPEQSIARALASNNEILNAVIAGTIAASDGFSLSSEEAKLIDSRIDAINAYIKNLADANPTITLVDTNGILKSVVKGEIVIGSETVTKTFGGGTFSLDGVHLSHTGYAFIANAFINAINSALGLNISETDLNSIWAADPYHDHDGDGYVPGPKNTLTISPAQTIINPMLIPLSDCDDTNPDIVASYISGVPCQ